LTVHNRTATDAEIRETFQATDIFYSLRINPYIEFTVAKYPEFKKTADAACAMLLNEKIALVHGDYSPKNILVSGENIFVLDMEVAHFGHPAFDVAFFLNHFLLKSIKNKMWSGAYLTMLSYMSDIYLSGLTCMDAREMESQTVRTLAFLFLARVDGKSPAEYITTEEDKNLIRKIAFAMLRENLKSFPEVISLVKAELNGLVRQPRFTDNSQNAQGIEAEIPQAPAGG
jgi:thiamine kinase-like enzyme